MKNNFPAWIFFICCMLPVCTQAQLQYSAWSVDPTVKTLKARYMYFKATDGFYWIKLEIVSSLECKLQLTSSVCNKDKNDMNGWKSIRLEPGKPKTVGFKVFNSCNNGWWWWYRAYNKISYSY